MCVNLLSTQARYDCCAMRVDLHSRRVTLPEHMALELATRWHDELLPALQPELMVLDGSQVRDIDVPALEALVAFVLARTQRRLVTRWSQVSPTLLERIETLGLEGMLLLPAAR